MSSEPKNSNHVLRRERQLRGWSQQKVASFLDTSVDAVSRWERGASKPSPFFREKFCALYSKSTDELGLIEPQQEYSPSLPIVDAADVGGGLDDRLDYVESIINLAWDAWFASRPRQALREVTKLLTQLDTLAHAPEITSSAVRSLRLSELVIRGHGLLGAIQLDGLQNDAAFYHYMRAYRLADEINDTAAASTYLASVGDVLRRQGDKGAAISHMERALDRTTGARDVGRETRGHILRVRQRLLRKTAILHNVVFSTLH